MHNTKRNATLALAARTAIARSSYTLSARLGGDSRRPSARCDRARTLLYSQRLLYSHV